MRDAQLKESGHLEKCLMNWEIRNPELMRNFQNYQYPQHQKFASPLINAGIKCTEQFLLDYMHMVYLGVVKRIVSFLKRGPRVCKLSGQQLEVILEQLVSFNGLFPSEFSRQRRLLYGKPLSLGNFFSTLAQLY